MKTRNIITSAALACITLFTACIPEETPCDNSLVPKITANTTLTAGSTLNLSVTGIEDVKMYNWYGPNRFSSHEQNPSIPNVSGVNAGKYTVDVITNTGCIYTAVSETVTVGGATDPCNVTNNTAQLNGVANINLSYISSVAGGGSYKITANGSGGDLQLEFYGSSKPVNGVYDIESGGLPSATGKVTVSITASSSLWYPAGGKVYVTLANNKVTASFCNVQFTSLAFGYKTNGSAKVTEK